MQKEVAESNTIVEETLQGIRSVKAFTNEFLEMARYRERTLDIARLTQAIGFKYKRAGNDFIHTASIAIVSKDRKITRYLNGTYFLPFELTMALTEASEGISAPTVNRILQYCFAYDPAGQKYVLSMTRVALPMITLTVVVLVLILVVRTRKNKPKPASE